VCDIVESVNKSRKMFDVLPWSPSITA